jgi:hypothetical protein
MFSSLSSHAIVLHIIIIVKDLPEAITGCILFIVVHWGGKFFTMKMDEKKSFF